MEGAAVSSTENSQGWVSESLSIEQAMIPSEVVVDLKTLPHSLAGQDLPSPLKARSPKSTIPTGNPVAKRVMPAILHP